MDDGVDLQNCGIETRLELSLISYFFVGLYGLYGFRFCYFNASRTNYSVALIMRLIIMVIAENDCNNSRKQHNITQYK